VSNLAEYSEQLEPLKRAFLALERMQEQLEPFEQASEKSLVQAGDAAIEEREMQRVSEIKLLADAEIAVRLSLLEHRWYSDEHRIRVEQLSLLKRVLFLLENMQEQPRRIQDRDKKAHTSRLPPLQPVSRGQELPLSFAQQRLWFLDQLEPGKSTYNEYGALQLKRLLNYTALEQSIQDILRRHESLRTIFPSVHGKVYQRILPWLSRHIARVNLQDLPPAEREVEARYLAEEEIKQPFDLAHGPLFKVTLFQLAEEEHLFLVIFHHIIGDGWSLGVFYRELATLYAAYCRGEPTTLVPLPIQYVDFAVWQQRWLQGDVLEEQLAYWVKQLEGATTVLELPTDHPRPALQTNQGAIYSFNISTALVGTIKELSQREGVTLFMTLLAAFQTLLYRYTGQEDILIGTTIANRISTELEAMIGFFANTLVLRGDLSGNPSFRELLKRVHEMALGAYTHQGVPFEQLVSTLHVQRDLTRSPLFQVMFVMQKAEWLDAELAELEVSSFALQSKRATFDLVLSIVEGVQDLHGSLEYSTDLFEETTIARLAGHFQKLLTQVVNQPDLPLTQISLLTEVERQQLLVEWNNARGDYARLGIHELVETQVARTPDAVAVVYKDEQLTYEQLNQRANQFAHYLRKIGVGPEVLVGICIERSLEMIVGILGVLKAGGAYIPLDPTYPVERLTYIIKDAAAYGVLMRQHFAPLLASSPSKFVYMDTDWSEIALESGMNPVSIVDSQNLAYAIYTSGSTGKPKGVLIEHAGLCSLIDAQIRDFRIGTHSRVLQFVSFSFDVSVADIFMTLCAGAMLCLVPLEDMVPGPALLTLLRERGMTIARIPPSVLAALPTEELPGLEVLICGGESWSSDIVARWGARRRFMNEYGPTETTICATMAECGADSSPTIGHPLRNVQTYVLDDELVLVPIGVPGQLYIGGAGLARGYLHRADITAESFVPDPFSAGARLYKTGDQVCYLPDGTLKFLGRFDEQVKVRGYRIELGEIEAVLALHPRVRESIVLVREDQEGDKKLVAYVVVKEMPAPSTSELHRMLKEHLPEYMVPSSFVLLEALPLNPNGKVNRHALPAPEYVRPELDEGYVVPQTTVEQKVAAVWQEVLQIERVGLQDNFFELGGHSFSMVQVHRKLQELLKPDLTLIDLFQYPTIRTLADFLTQGQKAPVADRNTFSSDPSKQAVSSSPDIAIIGMAGRFPRASSVDEFWENLREGIESVSFFSEEELLASGVDAAILSNPHYVPAGAVLEDIEYFDASFFGYSPREAEVIDPQQRLFLECAWQALEHTGYDPDSYPHSVAVYAGMSMNTYLAENLQGKPAVMGSVSDYQLVMSNSADFLTTRVSYKLNLRGPSVTVQTACSTSLVAVHMACESLRAGKCDMALAGGVSVRVPQKVGYVYQEGGIMSPDGHCRAFDAQAQGIVGGEGLGIVVLKRLEDAVADGDTIHAVIKGSAVNNDGSEKAGYTAPSVQGQARVITEALALAEIAPETVSYIEAHGTGTPVGDPIEVMALRQAYATHERRGGCALGSVKTNVGHLDAAAGITGLLKTVQALKHKLLPPSLHYNTPNPALDLEHSLFYVNKVLTPWEWNGTPRRAGVSSFGVGGTNAHVLLEEAAIETLPSSHSVRPWHVIVLSTRTATALQQARLNLAEYLRQHPDLPLADVAYTLQVGRRHFSYRSVAICQNIVDAIQVLYNNDSKRILHGLTEKTERPVVFLFPGQGAQYSGMAQDLYENEPVFRREIDRCSELLIRHLGCDLRTVLFTTGDDADEQLKQTWLTQPALFVVEYALARLWMSWGVRPTALIGHSIGEYVAACLSEVFSLEAALKLVAMRGRLMQQLPTGAMLAVSLPEQHVQQLLSGEQLSIAAINTPTQCVISGPTSAIELFERQLLVQDIAHRRLQTSHAFHSAMMDPILETFAKEVRSVLLQPPKLHYISNISGTLITNAQATDPEYWVQHLRWTVRFADGVQHILSKSECVLLEVGPGQTLGNFVKQQLPREQYHLVVSSLPRAKDAQSDVTFILTSLGRLWLTGVTVEWSGPYNQERRQRVPLPTYPFERQRYWIERPYKAVNEYVAFDGQVEPEHKVIQDSVEAPLHPRPLLPSAYVAPRNELELQIVDIWQQLLGIDGVGIHDNFFDLGGHSLLATQIASRLQSVFQVDLPLRSLFETLTVAELSEYIASQLNAKRSLPATQIVPVSREGYIVDP
jgi:amino acid adenylation domain-containing protein